MRRRAIALVVLAGLAVPAMACAQQAQPAGGKLRLGYTRWDSMNDEARRWDSSAFARFSQDDQRWGETKDGPRSARIGYGLTDSTELFVGVTKSKGADSFEQRRDWNDLQARNRKAYAIGVTKRW